jgi:hypothetical protein
MHGPGFVRYARYHELHGAPLQLQLDLDGVVRTLDSPPLLDPTDHHLLLTAPTLTVPVLHLSPGTAYRFRSRCVAGGVARRWELPWSEATVAATLRPPRHAPSELPPQVLRVMGTLVALRVRNPGKLAVRVGAPFRWVFLLSTAFLYVRCC